jgi:hypothetical protein
LNPNLYLNLVFEDDLSGAVLRHLLMQVRPDCEVGLCYRTGGKGNIKRKLRAFNKAAKGQPYLILVDLDEDHECPPALLQDWIGKEKHPNLYFRVAVHEVESWLLASRRSFAGFLGIDPNKLPMDTDTLTDPKKVLLALAGKSKRRTVREDIVPLRSQTARVGPNYNGRLMEFIYKLWDYEEASQVSPSLQRTIECLRNM